MPTVENVTASSLAERENWVFLKIVKPDGDHRINERMPGFLEFKSPF